MTDFVKVFVLQLLHAGTPPFPEEVQELQKAKGEAVLLDQAIRDFVDAHKRRIGSDLAQFAWKRLSAAQEALKETWHAGSPRFRELLRAEIEKLGDTYERTATQEMDRRGEGMTLFAGFALIREVLKDLSKEG